MQLCSRFREPKETSDEAELQHMVNCCKTIGIKAGSLRGAAHELKRSGPTPSRDDVVVAARKRA
jgi:hypothetical protein